MKTIKLGVFGASGKMGQAVRNVVLSQMAKDVSLFMAVSSQICHEFAFSVSTLKDVELEILQQVDVWIDFSSVEKTFELFDLTSETNSPVICGVTGFSTSDFNKLKLISKKRPVFWSSNMSLGVWALRQALKSLGMLGHFDFAVEEIHHTLKKDNPSGTAKTLHEDLEQIVSKKIASPIGKRLGGVFGVHKVIAASKSEMITFEHTALNREVFAEGALKAAKWIVNKKNGYYSMEDLASSLNS